MDSTTTLQEIHLALIIPGFLKTGLAKISSHSTTWQFKTTKLIQRPIKNLYITPGSALMVPRSIPTSPNFRLREVANWCHFSLEIFKFSELQRKSAWLRLT